MQLLSQNIKTAIAEVYWQSLWNFMFLQWLFYKSNTKRIAIGIALIGFDTGDNNHHEIKYRNGWE
jgi:hypothetical protein